MTEQVDTMYPLNNLGQGLRLRACPGVTTEGQHASLYQVSPQQIEKILLTDAQKPAPTARFGHTRLNTTGVAHQPEPSLFLLGNRCTADHPLPGSWRLRDLVR